MEKGIFQLQAPRQDPSLWWSSRVGCKLRGSFSGSLGRTSTQTVPQLLMSSSSEWAKAPLISSIPPASFLLLRAASSLHRPIYHQGQFTYFLAMHWDKLCRNVDRTWIIRQGFTGSRSSAVCCLSPTFISVNHTYFQTTYLLQLLCHSSITSSGGSESRIILEIEKNQRDITRLFGLVHPSPCQSQTFWPNTNTLGEHLFSCIEPSTCVCQALVFSLTGWSHAMWSHWPMTETIICKKRIWGVYWTKLREVLPSRLLRWLSGAGWLICLSAC